MPQLPLGSDGTYLGRPQSFAIDETEDTGTVTLSCPILITHSWDAEFQKWENVESEAYEVYGYFTLRGTKEKGSQLNRELISLLATLYGWTNGSFEDLVEIDPSTSLIQFVCQTRNYQGQDRISASFPKLPQAVVTKGRSSDPETLKRLTGSLAGQIRAIAKPSTAPIFDPYAAEANAPKDDIPYNL